jgi:hypothetical protein
MKYYIKSQFEERFCQKVNSFLTQRDLTHLAYLHMANTPHTHGCQRAELERACHLKVEFDKVTSFELDPSPRTDRA